VTVPYSAYWSVIELKPMFVLAFMVICRVIVEADANRAALLPFFLSAVSVPIRALSKAHEIPFSVTLPLV